MRRTAPCGTERAYKRHLRLAEMPCKPCRDAHAAEYRMWQTNLRVRKEAQELADQMAEHPPDIEWRNGRGRNGWPIKVGLVIDDPYMDHPNAIKESVN